MRRSEFLAAALVVASLLLIVPRLRAQEASYEAIADTVEVGTVAVSRSWPRAQIIEGRLATRENIALLANVKTICVLPYDGWKAKNIIDGLPALDGIRSGLEADKALRQQRNEAIEQALCVESFAGIGGGLRKRGDGNAAIFVVVDCILRTRHDLFSSQCLWLGVRGLSAHVWPKNQTVQVLAVLCGCRECRWLGGNAPEDHGSGLLNGFQALAQETGVSVPKLDVVLG